MGNIHVKLYGIWTSGSEGDVVLLVCFVSMWYMSDHFRYTRF